MNCVLRCLFEEEYFGDGDTIFDYTDYNDAYSQVEESLQLGSIDNSLSAHGFGAEFDMSYLVDCIAGGNFNEFGNYIGKRVRDILVMEIDNNKQLMLSLIVIVLLGSIFTRLAISYSNSSVSENGFYITYLLITSITLTAFNVSLSIITSTISRLIILIRIIVPVFMVAMNFVGHAMAATASYQLVMLAIWLVEAILLRILVPLIKFYVIISLINNLNKEEYFSKLSKLIANTVNYILKFVMYFVVGLNLVKGLIGPQMDMIGKTSVNRLITSMPGGGLASMLTGTFLAAGMVIKNSVGIAAVCLLLLLVVGPVVKLFVIRLMVKLVAVIVEPIGDKRYVEGIDTLAKGLGMMLKVVYSSVVLFVLTIAIMAFTTNS